MKVEERYELYKEAIEFYGAEHQEEKAIEEMAELTQAIIKHRHNPNKDTLLALIEEMADVANTQEQLQLIDIKEVHTFNLFDAVREEKLEKLRRELEKDKKNGKR